MGGRIGARMGAIQDGDIPPDDNEGISKVGLEPEREPKGLEE